MNRLPLLLSIVAVVIAVIALGLAILLPGPQGPKGDTGPQGIQGIQGIQGPPSSLSVQRQVVTINVTDENEMSSTGCSIELNAGDVLQGYIHCSGAGCGYVVYQVEIWQMYTGHGQMETLGSGLGGCAFCFVANATGTYSLSVGYNVGYTGNYSSLPWPLPHSEDVPVVYWVQAGNTTQAG